jgi:hypothetical protein
VWWVRDWNTWDTAWQTIWCCRSISLSCQQIFADLWGVATVTTMQDLHVLELMPHPRHCPLHVRPHCCVPPGVGFACTGICTVPVPLLTSSTCHVTCITVMQAACLKGKLGSLWEHGLCYFGPVSTGATCAECACRWDCLYWIETVLVAILTSSKCFMIQAACMWGMCGSMAHAAWALSLSPCADC